MTTLPEEYPTVIPRRMEPVLRATFGNIGRFRILVWVVTHSPHQPFNESEITKLFKDRRNGDQPAGFPGAMKDLVAAGMAEDLGPDPLRKFKNHHRWARLPHPMWDSIASAAHACGFPRLWVTDEDTRYVGARLRRLERELADG